MQPSIDQRIEEFIGIYKTLARAAGEPILSRRDLTFDAVFSYAADMTIVALHSDEEWTVCLNGTGHCERAQIDRTGRNVLETCSPEDRSLHVAIAKDMFETPCGLCASLTETFEDGQWARTETTSLPLLGRNGERMIVTFALLAEDIEDPYRDRPVLRSIEITSFHFVDLGYGTPREQPARLIA